MSESVPISVRVESNGTSNGTKVYFNDQWVQGVRSINYSIAAPGHYSKLTLEVIKAELKLDGQLYTEKLEFTNESETKS